MPISAKSQNRLIYFFGAAIILAVSFLFWSFNGSSGPEEKNPTESAHQAVPEQNAPLAEAVPPVQDELRLPAIEISPAAPVTVVAEEEPEEKAPVNIAVPFTSQAPLYEWKDQRQQDGCEEASVLMAMAWINNEKSLAPAEWKKRILALADWEQEKYGEHRDISVQDTVDWMFKDYFSYDKVRIEDISDAGQIVAELEKGNIILAPVNGRALKNPNFTAPGPEHHFIVIKGYDYAAAEFITNDPGTRLGKDYRYPEATIYEALRAYPTGYHDHYEDVRKQAIIVEK